MPSTYIDRGKQQSQPPRLNALTQRATRFRAKAGCLSWGPKGHIEKKNEYILSMLPEECKKPEVNSTKSMTEDLNINFEDVESAPERKEKYTGDKSEQGLEVEAVGEGDAYGSFPANDRPGPSDPTARECQERDATFNLFKGLQEKRKLECQEAAKKLDLKNSSQNRSDPEDGHSAQTPEFTLVRRNSRRASRRTTVAYQETEDNAQGHSPQADDDQDVTDERPRERMSVSPLSTRSPSPPPPRGAQGLTGLLSRYAINMVDDTRPMYSADFQEKTNTALAKEKVDYRYMTPHGKVTDVRDRAAVRRALELTCIDFCKQRGHAFPKHLLESSHNESYASQHRQMQEEFKRVWCGSGSAPSLYRLPAWTDTFDGWKVPRRDDKGQRLVMTMKDAEKLAVKMDRA